MKIKPRALLLATYTGDRPFSPYSGSIIAASLDLPKWVSDLEVPEGVDHVLVEIDHPDPAYAPDFDVLSTARPDFTFFRLPIPTRTTSFEYIKLSHGADRVINEARLRASTGAAGEFDYND
ncbi:MAG: hypothetical protein ABIJ92_03275 [Candidatus Aenigmatarchaeota archaeon]